MPFNLTEDLIIPLKFICYNGSEENGFGTRRFLKSLTDKELRLYTEFRRKDWNAYGPLISNEWNRRTLVRPASPPSQELLRGSAETKGKPTQLLRASNE